MRILQSRKISEADLVVCLTSGEYVCIPCPVTVSYSLRGTTMFPVSQLYKAPSKRICNALVNHINTHNCISSAAILEICEAPIPTKTVAATLFPGLIQNADAAHVSMAFLLSSQLVSLQLQADWEADPVRGYPLS